MNRWTRLAVIGDSIAAGVREPAEGYEDLSWTDRITRELGTRTLNLGERDLTARRVRETQLAPALAFLPDLAVVVCGGNDAFQEEFDADALAAELDLMVGSFRGLGADVVTLGLFDNTSAGLTGRRFQEVFGPRLRTLNQITRQISALRGAVFVDFSRHPSGSDPSIYASDRIHLNAKGHAIAAEESLRMLAAHADGTTVSA
ncbi:SGNH/GDSL hydrolase family protein [Actinocorallia libanotica]|uniref:SGNH hydrolase-type esterase domain-containing protein n=1 Tax=Actinocorallia libanotica TaxID=46162 RepID=A0ABP4CCS6_9ACTN